MEIQIGMHCKLFMDETEYIIEDLVNKELVIINPTDGFEHLIPNWIAKLKDKDNPNIKREINTTYITETF